MHGCDRVGRLSSAEILSGKYHSIEARQKLIDRPQVTEDNGADIVFSYNFGHAYPSCGRECV